MDSITVARSAGMALRSRKTNYPLGLTAGSARLTRFGDAPELLPVSEASTVANNSPARIGFAR